jgi:ubiquinone/menaquinone biosynthesis C-methylase UbiE
MGAYFTREQASNDIIKYLQSCKSDFWREVFRAELSYLLQCLEGTRDILSVGCGPAIIESGLSEYGFSVTGLDISREALDSAPDRIRKVVARAEDIPFPDSSFDAVTYVASLQFIEDYRKAIERTTDVLRPDGKLVAMILNTESGFFKGKLKDPNSYVHRIRHVDTGKMEAAIADKFYIQTEYFMGTKDGKIFDCRNAADAALYVIIGTRKSLEYG